MLSSNTLTISLASADDQRESAQSSGRTRHKEPFHGYGNKKTYGLLEIAVLARVGADDGKSPWIKRQVIFEAGV